MAKEYKVNDTILIMVKGVEPGTCTGCWFDNQENASFEDCLLLHKSQEIPACGFDFIFIEKPKQESLIDASGNEINIY